MKIKYVVHELHIIDSGLASLSHREFNGVKDAIEFKKAKSDGGGTWWDILVEYEE